MSIRDALEQWWNGRGDASEQVQRKKILRTHAAINTHGGAAAAAAAAAATTVDGKQSSCLSYLI